MPPQTGHVDFGLTAEGRCVHSLRPGKAKSEIPIQEVSIMECPDCDSRGGGVCSTCHGEGITVLDEFNRGITGEGNPCRDCNGSKKCKTCGGTGEI